jgi:hypothetical protein
MSYSRGACDGRGVFVAPLAQLLLSHLPLLNSTLSISTKRAQYPPVLGYHGAVCAVRDATRELGWVNPLVNPPVNRKNVRSQWACYRAD